MTDAATVKAVGGPTRMTATVTVSMVAAVMVTVLDHLPPAVELILVKAHMVGEIEVIGILPPTMRVAAARVRPHLMAAEAIASEVRALIDGARLPLRPTSIFHDDMDRMCPTYSSSSCRMSIETLSAGYRVLLLSVV